MTDLAAVPLFDDVSLSTDEQHLLDHLVDEADPAGVVHGFTFTGCSQELGLGISAGRRTMGPWLQRLAELGHVDVRVWPLGRRRGVILVNRAKPRETARPNRAVDAWQPRAADFQPRAATARPRECHKEQDLQAVEVQKLASQPARETEPEPETDWADDELEELLEPLLGFCRRCSPPLPGLTGRDGALAALRPYRRDQITRAVALVLAEVRRSGRIAKPVGLLVKMAAIGSAEYFPETVPVRSVSPGPSRAAVAEHDAEHGVGDVVQSFDPEIGSRGLAAARRRMAKVAR